MKKKLGILLAVILCLCMSANVWADAGKSQSVDYKTDYYMIVESPDGGIDMYSEASTDSPKLNDELVPNGTAIHVEGEHKDDADKIWVYAQLHGMFGFLQENYLKPATLAEAIASELKLFGSKDVDYDITVNAKNDGSVSLYKGPGKKYGTVSGGTGIANGEKLHISTEVDTGKDGVWGETTANGVSGWVNIGEATNTEETTVELIPGEQEGREESTASVQEENDSQTTLEQDEENGESSDEQETENVEQKSFDAQQKDTEEVGKSNTESEKKATLASKPAATPTPTVKPANTATPTPTSKQAATATPAPTATPTPEPTSTVTPAPENTVTPTTEAAGTEALAEEDETAATPTPEPENTVTPTPEPESTATPTPEPTDTVAPTPEATNTEAPTEAAEKDSEIGKSEDMQDQEASSENAKSSSIVQNPLIWVLVIAILIGVVIVIFLLKKRKNQDEEEKKE